MEKRRIVLSFVALTVVMLLLSVSNPLFANPLTPDRVATVAESVTTNTFYAVADSYVSQSYPTTNYGTSTQFRLDGSPIVNSYVRFTVSGMSGTVTKARLWIYANSTHTAGYDVYGVTNNTWSETGITYSNAPARGALLGVSGAITAGTWVPVYVTPFITGNGTYSFALGTTSVTALSQASRESAYKPQLIVTTDGGTGPTPVPPTATPVGPTPTKVPPTATPVGPTPTKVPPTATVPPPPPSGDPIFIATGDSRTGCNSGATATANLLSRYPGSLVAFVGDAVDSGTATQFSSCFDTTFGKYKSQLRPIPGNHEYGTSGASGYFGYFGSQAGAAGKGYYSFNVGAWHIVSLNSEIDISATSAQLAWFKADLAANPTQCSIVQWHRPRFSSGNHGNNTDTGALYQAAYDGGVDIYLGGHDHDYERFAPMSPSGALDNARGIREFVVGIAGAPPYAFASIQPNSQARMTGSYGLVQFTLHANSYDWKYVPATGSYADSGSGTCH